MTGSTLVLFTKWLVAAETLTAIAGFITWKKWKVHYLKWMPFYLAAISVLEIVNRTLEHYSKYDTANKITGVEVLFEMLFINWFFYKTLAADKRKIIIAGCTVYAISCILERTIFIGTGYYFASLSYTVGNLFILIYLILFFTELVNSDKLLNFKKLAVFWISLGMLVFYMGTFPFYGLYNELAKNLDIFIPVAWAATSLNYSMYLLFTIGLLWGKPQ